MTTYKIAIVGAGPGGMSAAAHAAELEVPHVLLEGTPHHANTIQRYQKGKHIMSEPNALPLRSPLAFQAGTREEVLDIWQQGLQQIAVNAQYDSEVTAIEGSQGAFRLTLKGGGTVAAENVILGIGVQGNPRKLGVPGEELPLVQYTLDDPDEYRDESIVVVGAGDAAIENAVALAKQNRVAIVNRRDEFARAKDGNNTLILRNIDEGRVECFYKSNPARIETSDGGERPYVLVLTTESGEAEVPCNRIIARLGAVPQRNFVESFGVEFTSDNPAALPALSEKLESSVPGLYVVGALAGNPLIKHAMNQGYEVVEHILGNPIEPVEYGELRDKFSVLPFAMDVGDTLQLMQERVPMFGEINPLLFREFMFDSNVLAPAAGEPVYRKNDYTNTFFTVLTGHVETQLEDGGTRRIEAGQVFGEQSLISGRRRNATVVAGDGCVLVETPRRTMVKLINSNESIAQGIDELFALRAIQQSFAPNTPEENLREVARASETRAFKPGEYIYREGETGDSLHLIRVGSVTLSRQIGGRDVVLSYVPAGNYIGELGLMGDRKRMDSARASVHTETITIGKQSFLDLLEKEPGLKEQVQAQVQKRVQEETALAARPEGGDVISFFMEQGLGESTDVLIIDESLCVGCNNCEKACAETHDGTSRLDREAGASFESMHVPISCRHCEHPHCMKDCPPDAIHRAADGEVFIDDSCIGCGNCVSNCPYGVIQLAQEPPGKPGLMRWLLLGAGPGPGEDKSFKGDPDAKKKAVKCDMCKDLSGGPACVRACPTGAALRLSPGEFVELVNAE